MRVAFFNYLPLSFGGGLASSYAELSSGLKKRHRSVKADCVSFDEFTAKLIQAAYSAYFLRNETLRKFNGVQNRTAHTLYQLGRILAQYDVVYTKNDILELTLMRLIGLSQKLPPVVVGFHTPIHYEMAPTVHAKLHNALYSSAYYRSLLNQAAGFHVLNSYHEKRLKDLIPEKPVAKIYNPIDKNLFRPANTNHRPGTPLALIWVGRLTKDKGFDDLIELIQAGRRRRVEWTVVGDGAMRPEIMHLIKTHRNIRYFPGMSRDLLAREYRRHHVFVSTSKWECLPYTVLEAQFSGIPVLAYDIPGCNDIVIPKATGILVKNAKEMNDRIDTIKVQNFERKKIRKNLQKRFDTEESYRRLYEFLKTFNGALR